jgi:hypothetical protein
MRIPRSRGAVSGLLLMVLGAWGALIPFIGPYFNVSMGTDETWDWSSGRLWLSVVPGVVAFLGGLLTLTSAHRAKAGFGAWMAIAAGAWFVVGPTVSMLWNDGTSAAGNALGSTNERVLTLLVSFDALGVAIAVLGAFALGRLAVRSVRDVELAREDERERERERVAEQRRFERAPATTGTAAATDPDRDLDRVDAGRDRDGVADRDDDTVVAPRRTAEPEPAGIGADASGRTVPTRDPDVERTATGPAPTPGAVASTQSTQRSGGLMGRLKRN